MTDRIDQRLLKQLDGLQDHEVATAVIAFDPVSALNADAGSTAQAMIEDASRASGETPTQVHIQPRLGTMFVSAPRALLRQLLEDERVSAASCGSD